MKHKVNKIKIIVDLHWGQKMGKNFEKNKKVLRKKINRMRSELRKEEIVKDID